MKKSLYRKKNECEDGDKSEDEETLHGPCNDMPIGADPDPRFVCIFDNLRGSGTKNPHAHMKVLIFRFFNEFWVF